MGSNDRTPALPLYHSKWASRFTWAAIIQGSVVALLAILLAGFSIGLEYPRKLVEMMLTQPEIGFSEITALAGLGLYLVVGVIGTGISAQFYHHFEVRENKPYRGFVSNALAWTHLFLMNIGVAATGLMMIYSGYLGDIAVTPKDLGGFGMTVEQASQQILNPFIMPVASMLLVVVAGAVTGGAGFIMNNFMRR